MVILWGPFLALETLAPLAKDGFSAKKAIPPQLLENLVTKGLEYMAEEDVMTSTSLLSIIINALEKLLTHGTLSSLITMITSIQLILHFALINV